MTISAQIRQAIEGNLFPEHFEVINESHKHVGHAGHDGSGESHFKLIIVSTHFEGYNRIARHRMVYDLLGPLFSKGLHALSLKTLSPSEYKPTL
jgi:BolA protein